MDPEQGLLVIPEYVPVELFILLFRALVRVFAPERVGVVEEDRAPADLELLLCRLLVVFLLLGLDDLDDDIVRSSLRLRDGLRSAGILLREIDLSGHEGAVLLNDFLSFVIVCELGTVLCQMQCDGRAKRLPAALVHGISAAAVALPVYRLRAFLIGKGVDRDKVCHHKCAVKAQSEMTDDLVIRGLVFIFFQESFRAGKSDVVDVLFDLVRGHADTVIGYCDRLLLRAHLDVDPGLVIFGQCKITHHIQLPELGDRIASVGDQFPVENIVVTVEPLLDYWEHILTVN